MKNSKAILQVPGTMKIISAEIPVPKEDEVLIKVEYVGICGSDVHGFESGPFIPPKDPNQEIGLGHECAGTVVAVGSRAVSYTHLDVYKRQLLQCELFVLGSFISLAIVIEYIHGMPSFRFLAQVKSRSYE